MTARLMGPTQRRPRQLVVTARENQLSTIRRHVRDLVAGDPSNEAWDESITRTIADLELVVSELATNAIQHSDCERITVFVQRVGRTWIIEVDGADALPVADAIEPVRPPDVSPTGRGLLLVHALTDSVEVIERDGRRVIRCLKRTSSKGG